VKLSMHVIHYHEPLLLPYDVEPEYDAAVGNSGGANSNVD